MMWRFLVDGAYHEAEWRDGAMRCTESRVVEVVDELIAAGGKVPSGSVLTMVEVGLQTAASAHATIHEAVMTVADFGSVESPQADFVPIDDVVFDDALGKASFGGDRSAAGRYAAQVRWGNRGNQAAENRDEDFLWMAMDAHMLKSNEEERLRVRLSLNPLSEDERQEVFRYTEDDADTINAQLRGVKDLFLRQDEQQRQDDTIKALDGLLERAAPLEKDVLLVRGVPLPFGDPSSPQSKALIQLGNLKEGESFVDKGFVSASSLSRPQADFDGAIRLEIVVPKGSKVLPIDTLSAHEHENEWLLPRGKRFRVLSAESGAFNPRANITSRLQRWLPDGESVTLRVVMEDA